jgi:hypothetical protein
MTTTPETIAELKRLLAESTPRPWYRTGPLAEDETGVLGGIDMGLLSEPDGTDLIDDPREADYDLIAAAVNALPALLADIEAAQQQITTLREALRSILMQPMANEWSREQARAALSVTEVK